MASSTLWVAGGAGLLLLGLAAVSSGALSGPTEVTIRKGGLYRMKVEVSNLTANESEALKRELTAFGGKEIAFEVDGSITRATFVYRSTQPDYKVTVGDAKAMQVNLDNRTSSLTFKEVTELEPPPPA